MDDDKSWWDKIDDSVIERASTKPLPKAPPVAGPLTLAVDCYAQHADEADTSSARNS